MEVCTLECLVEVERSSKLSLLLVQTEEALGCHGRDEEQCERPRRDSHIHVREQSDNRSVDRSGCEHDRNERSNRIANWTASNARCQSREEDIEQFANDGTDK